MAYKSTVYCTTFLHHHSDDSSLPAPIQAPMALSQAPGAMALSQAPGAMALSQAPGAMALGRGRGQLLVQVQVAQVITVDLDEES